MIGIICPSPYEYRLLARKALEPYSAHVLCSGIGKVKVVCACHRLLTEYPRMKCLLLIGFAGALTRSLNIGDVIEPTVFIEEDFNAEPFEKFPHLVRKSRSNRKLVREAKEAAALTQDRIVRDNPYEHGAYAARFKRLACDMESYALAYFCEKEKVPYSVIKVISDLADGSVEKDFKSSCRQLGGLLNRTATEAVRCVLKES